MRTSRSLFWLLIALALAAVILGAVSAGHKSFLEFSASSSTELLEREFIDVSRLSPEQKRKLERNLKAIRGSERYLSGLHASLWQVATFGFAGLAVGCLGCASFAYKPARHQEGKNAG